MIQIAIIGAGTMGTIHVQSCRNLPNAMVTWVADEDGGRAAALAQTCNARATDDVRAALAAADVDVVVVTVPTPFHRIITEGAAAHGKHVFCEKPIARTLADARAMVAACDRADVLLTVGHVVRFFPEYLRIHALLAEDAVGTVGVVRAARLNANPALARPWYGNCDWSGGVIVDLMIHDLDTLRWYFGEVDRVYARGLSGTAPHPAGDYALAVLRFANGVIAHVEASWAHANFRTSIEIAGSAGLLRHASEESSAIRVEQTAPQEDVAVARVQVPSSPLPEGPYQTELRHFLTAVETGTPPVVTGEEAVRSLALALAVLQSTRTGRPVHATDGVLQIAEDTL
ncbi:MAG: Gfo/Idh/MocA family oxidoreductase [Chloroflexota bacterium]|nr:Gfo/Idh/MocA family oxidoreductase [Chloroflexota bacterium]